MVISLVQSTTGLLPLLDAFVCGFGTPYLVGGTVRDIYLGHDTRDIDIEVFDLTPHELTSIASRHGEVKLVGESFGVYKVTLPNGLTVDISLPRREKKKGEGHRGFEVEVAPYIGEEVALARRDYTINSMLMSPFTGDIVDPYGGRADLSSGWLRATSAAFSEDALRVLRGMQFAARFDLRMDPITIERSRYLWSEYHTIARERIWEEWHKLFTKGRYFDRAFLVLFETGWMGFYPELLRLGQCFQEERWHPEGDVLVHTAQVMNVMARLADRDGLSPEQRATAMAAALVHDFGKPATTVFDRDAWRAPGHDKAGEAPARAFFERIGAPAAIVEHAVVLTKEHMAHSGAEVSRRNAQRLANRLHPHATIVEWERLLEADASGRHPAPPGRPGLPWLEMAVEAKCQEEKPKPLITGHMLIARGLKPGVVFKDILATAYDEQLDGTLLPENADAWLDDFLALEPFK